LKKLSSLVVALSLSLTLAAPSSVFAFGAIAVDDEEGEAEPGYGIATGESSESAAKSAALKECRNSGNKNCKVAVWFKKCGAYAASKKYSGTGFGDSKKAAESKALSECGDKSCKVVVSDCDE